MTQTAILAPNLAPIPIAPSQMRGSKGTIGMMRIATNPPKAPPRIPTRIVPKTRLMPTSMPKPLSLRIGKGCPDCSVHRVAADFSTGALCAEKSLTCQGFDVVRDRGMVMIHAPRELPNADAWSSAHLFDKGFLQCAERKAAPHGYITVRVVPPVVTSLFRVDESLFLQHPQMVCSNAVPEADRVSDFCE